MGQIRLMYEAHCSLSGVRLVVLAAKGSDGKSRLLYGLIYAIHM